MKKIISFITILAFLLLFFLTQNSYAASLDTLTVEVDKNTVRPAEEVKVTIRFGEALGAYTFDIAYDNNIFDYVSSEGGTANDTSDKVRITFHDSTGGSNPRQNASILFRAKADITTSNPTEFTVTGEGLANADASITYDDITTPIVKNITVEPVYQDYTIQLTHTGDIIEGEEKDMILSYSSSMGRYYEHARLIAEATTPSGASVKLTGKDATTQVEQDIIQSGWGDPQGYKIGGKDVSQILNVKALFSDKGEYTIKLKLIDRDNADNVIAEKQFSFTAVEKEAQVIPPVEEKPEQKPEEKPPIEQNTINNEQVAQTNQEQKPQRLPQTGNNVYVPMIIVMLILISVTFYYNRKINHKK